MTDDRAAPDTHDLLRTLAAVGRRLDAHARLDPFHDDRLLEAITATAATILDAAAASIALHDPARDRLVFAAASGPAAGEVVGLEIPSGAGIAGYAFLTGQPLAVADVVADPRFDRTVADVTGYLPGSLLATPLLDGEGTVGVLEILDRRGGSFTLRDLDVAAALAREATVVVRAGRSARDAAGLLRSAIVALSLRQGASDPASPALADDDIEALVAAATADLPSDPDDPTWRLADRVARLRDVDPGSVELAVAWLDALLQHRSGARRGPGSGR